ncbi:MAG: type II toxin-antitoxin system PemK/MazF family toxin [Sphingobacteriaceae bacterium]|nr:MAG: type II toxin-antitoxin system PemK/MazF family toxin [Sphingobacteriaceae bacterium]
MMNINRIPLQYEIWIADLDPASRTEPGKIRPVVILQADALHYAGHTSTIVCAISSQPKEGISLIRQNIQPSAENGLRKESYILIDQIRALDLIRLHEKIGELGEEAINILRQGIKSILSLN